MIYSIFTQPIPAMILHVRTMVNVILMKTDTPVYVMMVICLLMAPVLVSYSSTVSICISISHAMSGVSPVIVCSTQFLFWNHFKSISPHNSDPILVWKLCYSDLLPISRSYFLSQHIYISLARHRILLFCQSVKLCLA